jgi:hypothetical protein
MTPMKGNIKNLNKYIKDADRNSGAEYIYLFDERDQNWYMIDIYGDKELVPAFESVVTEGKHDEMLDKVADAVKNASNFMNVGIALKDAGIKYDFSTGMMPIYRLKKYPIAIVNKKYVDDADREVGDIAIGVMESLTESLITEALEGRSQKEAMKGYAAIHKFMMAHPGFASKTVSDQTVAWTMKEALKAALIDANFHTEAKSVGKAINFANFQAPTVFVNELGGMPIQISKKMMMDKVYELATEITRGAKYNGFAIIEAVAMFFDDSFPKNSSASNLRDVLAKFMGEAVEANNLEQRINEGSAFNSARLKAIADDKDEFEFDGKTYPVKSVDKEDEELADDLVGEGNAFSTARLKAIEAGEKEFEFDGKTYPVKSVDKEDEELADDLVGESNKTIDASTFGDDKLRYDDQFRGATGLAKTLASELGFDPKKPWTEGIGFDDIEMYAIGKKEGTISRNALSGKYTYADLLAMAKDFLGINESEDKEAADDVVDESRYDDIKLKEFAEFIKKAEGKRVMLTTTEFDGTSKVEGRLQKSSSGYHKIDYMSFDFKDEMDTIKKGDGMIMGVRVGEFLKYNIGGKNGSQFLIEVL